MRYRIFNYKGSSIVVIIIIVCIILVNINKNQYYVVYTSYSDNGSNIVEYNNDNVVDDKFYNISNTGKIEIDSVKNPILINKFANEIMDVGNKDINQYYVNLNPIQLVPRGNLNYMLFNTAINQFKLTSYSSTYKEIKSSNKKTGFARNFFIYKGELYVLANIYTEEKRQVVIYVIDINNFDTKQVLKIDENLMTYAFYMNRVEECIFIYGNKTEREKNLFIYKYDLNKCVEDGTAYSEKVMWVKKIINTKRANYLINDFSVIQFNKEYNIINKLFEKDTFIDFEYKESTNELYVLCGDYNKKQFYILIVDENLKIRKRIPIKYLKDKVPVDLILKSRFRRIFNE